LFLPPGGCQKHVNEIVSFTMHLADGNIYHVYNRGNFKQVLFTSAEEYIYFLLLVNKYIVQNCDVLAWCLMPNHFHFLIHANSSTVNPAVNMPLPMQQFSFALKLLLSSYTKAVNKKYGRTGNLFQQKTKAKNLSEGGFLYPETAFHYIHQNPFKANLVTQMQDWEYSSYKDYSGQRNGKICNRELSMKILNLDWDNFEKESLIELDKVQESFLF
jgi:putative transposase